MHDHLHFPWALGNSFPRSCSKFPVVLSNKPKLGGIHYAKLAQHLILRGGEGVLPIYVLNDTSI